LVLLSTRELDEGISGKVISGIGGSFRRNPQLAQTYANRAFSLGSSIDMGTRRNACHAESQNKIIVQPQRHEDTKRKKASIILVS